MRHAVVFITALLLHADPSQPVFATYLGGGGSEVVGSVAVDSQGNIYIAGRTDSPDFPLKNPIQATSKAFSQIFIAKFSPTGELLFSTYYGGSANDLATGIALDPAGNIYVTGALQSVDFPVANAFQPTSGGRTDAFVLKIDPAFHVVYATYVGGKFNDLGMAIAADAQGNAYITGRTESPDFPVTAGALDTTIAGYQSGSTFVDAFVTKLDPAGNLVYSTFLGGRFGNIGWGIAVDSYGQAHVTGDTGSPDFPLAGNTTQFNLGANGAGGFLSKLTADGSSLVYSILLGGPVLNSTRAVTLDASGNAYITGLTSNARLPIIGGTQLYLGGDVYLVSSDGGATFTSRRSGLAAQQTTAIAFDPNVQGLVYAGTLQGVFRSNDGGNTWTAAGLDTFNIQAMAVDPSQPGTVYAATASGGGGVFRSSDGGDTWSHVDSGYPGVDIRFATFTAIAVDPAGSGTYYVVSGSNGSGINVGQPVFRVTDNGATWTPIGQGLSTTVDAISVSPQDSTLYGGTASFAWVNQIFGGIYSIPGTVYKRISDAWVDTGLNDNIQALGFNGGTLYAAGQKFYQSTDGGQTWTSTPLPGGATAGQIAFGVGQPASIYLRSGGSPTQLLRSDDGGASFQVVNKGQFTTIAVNPFDSTLHAGTVAAPNAYLAEFDPNGTLVYSNFIGTADIDRGEGIALDPSGRPYIIGESMPGMAFPYSGSAFVASADGSYSVNLGQHTLETVLDTSNLGIAIGPDGSIIAVMIGTTPGLATANAAQGYLNGGSDVYLVKFLP
jgi:hypothetical protein